MDIHRLMHPMHPLPTRSITLQRYTGRAQKLVQRVRVRGERKITQCGKWTFHLHGDLRERMVQGMAEKTRGRLGMLPKRITVKVLQYCYIRFDFTI